jgi:hypothetical protein
VGSQTCAACHAEISENFQKSGHPFSLVAVQEGAAPKYPYSSVPRPPDGLTWNDVSYIIGGYRWKARFLDTQGYLVTGESQYNLENQLLGKSAAFVPYRTGEQQVVFDCGACHTTGYSTSGNQAQLPGLAGTWAENGVQCEACHGAGSLHASNPQGFKPQIRRDRQDCERCHTNVHPSELDVSGGLINANDVNSDLPTGKHAVVDCVLCHDPHTGVLHARKAAVPVQQTRCEECHFKQAQLQNNPAHVSMQLACVECHMPQMIQVAWGLPEKYRGDMRSHRIAIDPGQISQFTTEGALASTQISLDFACRRCHVEGFGSVKTDEQLLEVANGYHTPPQP